MASAAPAARRPWLAAAVAQLLWACGVVAEGPCSPGAGGRGCPARKHLWPRARGHPESYAATNLTGPSDLSRPLYQWHPKASRFHSVTICGPLIDDQNNLYVTSVAAIHKLSAEGKVIWEFFPMCGNPTPLCDCPSLGTGGDLYGTCSTGEAFAVDIDTGKQIWKVHHGLGSSDTSYVENYDGVMIFEYDSFNTRALGLNTSDGSMLWEFKPDTSFWNLMALFPGDDTVLFQDFDAKVYRIGLHNGTLLWKNGGGHYLQKTWTDGGAMLGRNGLIYAASSKSFIANHHATSGGGVHAYRVDTGELVWQRHLTRPFFTWPAVGRLAGQKTDSVVVAIGANAYTPWKDELNRHGREAWGSTFGMGCLGFFFLAQCYYCRCSCGGLRWCTARLFCVMIPLLIWPMLLTRMYVIGRAQAPIKTFEAEIYAYDANTGEKQWVYHLPPWPFLSAAGDDEGYYTRLHNLPARSVCLPAAYNAPTIDGRGTVWIGYHSGMMLGLRDENGDGIVSEDEVLGFDTKAAFLHSGPAFAPGMMAVVNCDSLWVWRT